MGELNAQYGSELHLLRYLARHRHNFHKLIESAIPGRVIDWVDFKFGPSKRDLEWTGLDFLPDYLPAKTRWRDFWPQSGGVQNWDAIGWIEIDAHPELLLVEAKAHVRELESETKASPAGGLSTIVDAFEQTKAAMGVRNEADWLHSHYQYCNRLATLHFLTENSIAARLLFVYFCGDCNPNEECPKSMSEWGSVLRNMHTRLGLTGKSILEKRVYNIFVPVGGPEK